MGSKQDSLGGNDGEDVGGGAATRGTRADRPFTSREISRSVPQVQRGRERGTDWGGTTTRAWTLARLDSSGARGWPSATPKHETT